MRFAQWAAALLLLAATAASVQAELTPEQKKEAQTLIAQFAAPDAAVRQQAVEKVIVMGPAVVVLIRKAYQESDDAEVDYRVRSALRGIAEKHAGGAPGAKPNLDASRVTLDVKDRPLAEVMQLFSEQTGNQAMSVPAKFADMPTTFSAKDLPYWEAIGTLCRTYQVLYFQGRALNTLRGGFSLLEGHVSEEAVGYAGPVVVKSTWALRSHEFSKPKVNVSREATAPGDSVQLGLAGYLEDRLPVFTSEIRVTRVLSPDGTVLVTNPDSVRNTDPSTRVQCSADCFITLPPGAPAKLDAVEGFVRLGFYSGEAEARMEDVFASRGRGIEAGDRTLVIKDVSRDGRRATIRIAPQCPAGNGRLPLQLADSPFGVFLLDPDGRRHGGSLSSWGGESTEFQFDGLPLDKLGALSEQSESKRPKDQGPWSLLFVYPEKIESREYPFMVRDISLAPGGAVPQGSINFDASRVSVDVKDMPVSEVLQLFADQTGNRMLQAQGRYADKPVTLSVRDMPYWQAVDRLCETAGPLDYGYSYHVKGTFDINEVHSVQRYADYCGPVVVKVTGVSRKRNLLAGALEVNVTYWLEDRLPAIQTDIFLTRILKPDGATILRADRDNPKLAEGSYSAMRLGGMVIPRVALPPEPLDKLGRVEGFVRVQFAVGQEETRLEDVLNAAGKTFVAEGITFTLGAFLRDGGTATVKLTTEYPYVANDLRYIRPRFSEQQYRMFLVDPKGNRHEGSELTAAYNYARVKDRTTIEHKSDWRFAKLPEIDGPWALICVAPKKRETREYAFAIKDVLLP